MNEIHLFLFSMGKNVCKSNWCSVERVLKICLSFSVIKKIKATEKLLVINAALLVSLNNFEDSKRLCCWVQEFLEGIEHELSNDRQYVMSVGKVSSWSTFCFYWEHRVTVIIWTTVTCSCLKWWYYNTIRVFIVILQLLVYTIYKRIYI